jgi:4-hydroxymandelate synthase
VEFDLLELWVGDLDHTRDLLVTAFGFATVDAECDPGPDERLACLTCGGVTVILRQGTAPGSPVARHVAEHGDTVGDVSLTCSDVGAVVERANAYGIRIVDAAEGWRIDLLGDGTVCHTVRDTKRVAHARHDSDGPRMQAIDHVAYCLPWGVMQQAARAYEAVFGLERLDVTDVEEVGGTRAGMRSCVLRSRHGFTVVLTEPLSREGFGQTQQFLDAHAGPGVQHAAIAYEDLVAAVEALRSRGVQFLPVPARYFVQARQRPWPRPLPWETLERLEILVDIEDGGLLYQLFTRPIADRKTFFFECIERAGATGFGANNVRALFEAVDAAMDDRPRDANSVEGV